MGRTRSWFTHQEALELTAAIAGMEQADCEIERFIEADVLFHRALLRATHDGLLRQVGSVVESAIRNHDRGVSAQRWVESRRLHHEVADAVSRRSPSEAEAAMRRVLPQALSDVRGDKGGSLGGDAARTRAPGRRR